MPLSMYQASIPVFTHYLGALAKIIDKAAAHAAARKIDPAVLCGMRIAPDMFPFAQQVRSATDHALRVGGGLSGVEPPKLSDGDVTFEQLKARIATTIDYLKGLKPGQIDGTEEKTVTLTLGGKPRDFKGQGLLIDFCMPNFYFHTTTAYAILRHAGVEIGKRDFMGMV